MDPDEQLGMGFFDEVAVPVRSRKAPPRRREAARDRRVTARPQTRVKLDAYQAYVPAWMNILGTRPGVTDVHVLDLFAGPGRYPDGEAGSPVIACEAALKLEERAISRARPVRCHLRFVESSPKTFALLGKALEPYRTRLDIGLERGRADEWVSTFAAEAEGRPTLVFLDPDGFRDVPFDMITVFRRRRFTEILLNFDLQAIMRVAGSDDISTLTAFCGDDMWRLDRDPDRSIDPNRFLEGYRRRLGAHFQFSEARRIDFPRAHANRAIVQACGSITGVSIWGDCFVSAYERMTGVTVLDIARAVGRRSRINSAITRIRELGEVPDITYGPIAQHLGGLSLTEDDRHQLLLFLRDEGAVTWTSVLRRGAPPPHFTFGRVPLGLRWDGIERPPEQLPPPGAASRSA